MPPGESQHERDQRINKLWETLDARREGQIDFKGLKKGLRKIDHREEHPPVFLARVPSVG
jgi:solute carrier family 25 phosphate transporter 23/24/25/41